jgi:hypothetical protein
MTSSKDMLMRVAAALDTPISAVGPASRSVGRSNRSLWSNSRHGPKRREWHVFTMPRQADMIGETDLPLTSPMQLRAPHSSASWW